MVQGSFDGCVNNSVIFSVNKSIKLLASKKSRNINSKGFQINIDKDATLEKRGWSPENADRICVDEYSFESLVTFTVIKPIFPMVHRHLFQMDFPYAKEKFCI